MQTGKWKIKIAENVLSVNVFLFWGFFDVPFLSLRICSCNVVMIFCLHMQKRSVTQPVFMLRGSIITSLRYCCTGIRHTRAATGGTAPGRADGSLSGGREGIKVTEEVEE